MCFWVIYSFPQRFLQIAMLHTLTIISYHHQLPHHHHLLELELVKLKSPSCASYRMDHLIGVFVCGQTNLSEISQSIHMNENRI